MYRIIIANDPTSLEEMVNDLIEAGFRPQGGLVPIPAGYVQVVTKLPDNNPRRRRSKKGE